jgi:1-acyl-sn-glycerol-3-phosphate acyltransferase
MEAAMAETEKRYKAHDPEYLQAHIDKALNLRDEVGPQRIYKLAQLMFDPQLLHVERINTERPSVFVANHGPYGWESALLPSMIREHTGMFPRLLADAFLMKGALEEPLMGLGLVLANREVCAALMDAGESIFVFPGGSREGAKRRGDQYKLFWEGRTGFVRMAIEHGFTITPVATVGPDEMWDIRWDSSDIKGTWIESLMRKAFSGDYDLDVVPPIPSGILGSPIPRPERFYIAFGEPFDTQSFAGRENDKRVLNKIKNTVQTELEALIKETLLVRTQRRHEMHWLRRMLTRH